VLFFEKSCKNCRSTAMGLASRPLLSLPLIGKTMRLFYLRLSVSILCFSVRVFLNKNK